MEKVGWTGGTLRPQVALNSRRLPLAGFSGIVEGRGGDSTTTCGPSGSVAASLEVCRSRRNAIMALYFSGSPGPGNAAFRQIGSHVC